MSDENQAPIVIKRIKKGGHGGHHGGAWKIAYADFVTAMMAFFLMMWLLGAATEDQIAGLAAYFSENASDEATGIGSGQILGGSVLGQGALSSGYNSLADHGSKYFDEDLMTEEEFERKMRQEEEKMFAEIKLEIETAITADIELAELSKNLVIDQTPEGLRIQLIDQQHTAMFPSGSSVMTQSARKLIAAVSGIITHVPNMISIEGNTDAVPYVGTKGYGNWELSADRALASRRELINNGVNPDKILRVTGRADTDPFDKEDPTSPTNRRINIIVLRNYKLAPPPVPAGQGPKERPRNPFLSSS